MKTSDYYTASEDLARRACLIGKRYKTADGRYILSTKDLMNIRFSAEEYVNGIDVVQVTEQEAQALIQANGYKLD